VQVMNAYGGSGGTAPFILNLSIKQGYVHLHIQTTATWGKCPQYPFHRKLSGPPKQSVCCEEGKNLVFLLANVLQWSIPYPHHYTDQATPATRWIKSKWQ
jgi:hypothetical protein